MIAVTVDRAAAEAAGRAAYPHPVSQELKFDSQARQSRRHGRQTVTLLDAQLKRSAHQRLALRAGGRDEEYRQLVDRDGNGVFSDLNAVQGACVHLDVRDRLARRTCPEARFTPWTHADIGAHFTQ